VSRLYLPGSSRLPFSACSTGVWRLLLNTKALQLTDVCVHLLGSSGGHFGRGPKTANVHNHVQAACRETLNDTAVLMPCDVLSLTLKEATLRHLYIYIYTYKHSVHVTTDLSFFSSHSLLVHHVCRGLSRNCQPHAGKLHRNLFIVLELND